MNDQLWREPATLTRLRDKAAANELTREILYEGSLRDVVAKAALIARVGDLHISLSERRARPFAFDADSIRALIDAHKLLMLADG